MKELAYPHRLVFEWHVVEGMVLGIIEDDKIKGLPGKNKALAAINFSGICLHNLS